MHNILMLVGFSIVLLSNIELMFNAFKKSLWWGLGYLCVPFASLVFVIKYWDDTKKAFAIGMLGVVLCLVALALGPGAMEDTYTYP